MYRSLSVEKTIDTIRTLRQRIVDRFPDSGLGKVCGELEDIAVETKKKIDWISKPNYYLRLGITILILAVLAGLVYSISLLDFKSETFGMGEIVQISEAAINDLVLIGAAVFFILTIETRVKRSRALKVLHELRSIAHVIDMHQLTKDPNRKLSVNTPASPQHHLTAMQLTRYLDYCSELLSLTGKVAALYAQAIEDTVVLDAVTEVEDLTTTLSQKIWQKIMIVKDFVPSELVD